MKMEKGLIFLSLVFVLVLAVSMISFASADDNFPPVSSCINTTPSTDYYDQGIVMTPVIYYYGMDQCSLDNKTLQKWYCYNGANVSVMDYACPAGCYNGACVPKNSTYPQNNTWNETLYTGYTYDSNIITSDNGYVAFTNFTYTSESPINHISNMSCSILNSFNGSVIGSPALCLFYENGTKSCYSLPGAVCPLTYLYKTVTLGYVSYGFQGANNSSPTPATNDPQYPSCASQGGEICNQICQGTPVFANDTSNDNQVCCIGTCFTPQKISANCSIGFNGQNYSYYPSNGTCFFTDNSGITNVSCTNHEDRMSTLCISNSTIAGCYNADSCPESESAVHYGTAGPGVFELKIGESRTITIGGTGYQISLEGINSNQATIEVNGENQSVNVGSFAQIGGLNVLLVSASQNSGESQGSAEISASLLSPSPSSGNSNSLSPSCSTGCEYSGKCIPFGYRVGTQYCDVTGNLTSQITGGACDNNFQCSSNLCVNSQCVTPSLIQQIINFFSKLLGI